MVIFNETKEGLQEGLDYVGVYCRMWDISVNTRKTNVVVFRILKLLLLTLFLKVRKLY